MNEYKTIIGERLQYLRKKQKMPVANITGPLGIERSTYTNWERGYRSPNGGKLVELASVFNTSVDFLTGKTDNEELNREVVDAITQGIKEGKFVHNGKPLTEKQAKQLADVIKALLPE